VLEAEPVCTSEPERPERPDHDGGVVRSRKIFLGGLSSRTNEAALHAHFKHYGVISDVVVLRQGKDGTSRSFGFVTFDDPMAAQRALKMRYQQLGGRYIEVKAAVPQEAMKLEPKPEQKGYHKTQAEQYMMSSKIRGTAYPKSANEGGFSVPAGIHMMPTLLGHNHSLQIPSDAAVQGYTTAVDPRTGYSPPHVRADQQVPIFPSPVPIDPNAALIGASAMGVAVAQSMFEGGAPGYYGPAYYAQPVPDYASQPYASQPYPAYAPSYPVAHGAPYQHVYPVAYSYVPVPVFMPR